MSAQLMTGTTSTTKPADGTTAKHDATANSGRVRPSRTSSRRSSAAYQPPHDFITMVAPLDESVARRSTEPLDCAALYCLYWGCLFHFQLPFSKMWAAR